MASYFDQQRTDKNFLTTVELIETIGERNRILDDSVLIGKNVIVGVKNTFYPGTYILSSAGEIMIGDYNEFGPAGVTVKSNIPNAAISIGGHGRYCDGVSIMGKTALGTGSQILGNITVQSCTLAGGGTFQEPDPDKRAAVLKGFGLARNLALEAGQVINGMGNFADSPIEQQSVYHPKVNH